MSRDHQPPLPDVTVDTESTASSIVACSWPRDVVFLLLRVGTYLRSCGLAMGIHVTILLSDLTPLVSLRRQVPMLQRNMLPTSALKMKAAGPSETLVTIYQTT
jgi:hypothetical protein